MKPRGGLPVVRFSALGDADSTSEPPVASFSVANAASQDSTARTQPTCRLPARFSAVPASETTVAPAAVVHTEFVRTEEFRSLPSRFSAMPEAQSKEKAPDTAGPLPEAQSKEEAPDTAGPLPSFANPTQPFASLPARFDAVPTLGVDVELRAPSDSDEGQTPPKVVFRQPKATHSLLPVRFAAVGTLYSSDSSDADVETPRAKTIQFNTPADYHVDSAKRKLEPKEVETKAEEPHGDSHGDPVPLPQNTKEYFEKLRRDAYARKTQERKAKTQERKAKRQKLAPVQKTSTQSHHVEAELTLFSDQPLLFQDAQWQQPLQQPLLTNASAPRVQVHEQQHRALASWLDAHQRRNPHIERAMMLYGPSGCGKTELARTVLHACGYVVREFGALDARGPQDIAGSIRDCSRQVPQKGDAPRVALLFTECEALSMHQRASVDALKALLSPWRFGARRHKLRTRPWLLPFIFIVDRPDARVLHGLAAACNRIAVPPFPDAALLQLCGELLPQYSAKVHRELLPLVEGNVRRLQFFAELVRGLAESTDPIEYLRRIGLADSHDSLHDLYAQCCREPSMLHATQLSFAGITLAPLLVQEHYLDHCSNLAQAAKCANSLSESSVFEAATDLAWHADAELREELAVFAIYAPCAYAERSNPKPAELRFPALKGKAESLRNTKRKLALVQRALQHNGAHCWSSDATLDYARVLGAYTQKMVEAPYALAALELGELELKQCAALHGSPISDADARALRRSLEAQRKKMETQQVK